MSNWQWGGSIIPLLIAQTFPLLIAPRQRMFEAVNLESDLFDDRSVKSECAPAELGCRILRFAP